MFRFSRRYAVVGALAATAATAFALSPSPATQSGGAGIWQDGKYPVVSVSDGDTLKVRMGGTVETVRVLGMDTPEKFATRTGNAECFWKEASDFATRTLAGKTVTLERDGSQAARDKYGRVLANVRLPDGSLYSVKAVGDGYALRYAYGKTPTRYDSAIKQASELARKAGLGIWTACGGKRVPKGSPDDKSAEYAKKSPTPSVPPKTGAPSASPSPAKTDVAPVPSSPKNPESSAKPEPTSPESAAGFSCSVSKRSCSKMASCEEARFYLRTCGVTSLDGDRDGTPCESLCR